MVVGGLTAPDLMIAEVQGRAPAGQPVASADAIDYLSREMRYHANRILASPTFGREPAEGKGGPNPDTSTQLFWRAEVRNRLFTGGSEIRTLGPPAGMSSHLSKRATDPPLSGGGPDGGFCYPVGLKARSGGSSPDGGPRVRILLPPAASLMRT
jgi:hypothetical protein